MTTAEVEALINEISGEMHGPVRRWAETIAALRSLAKERDEAVAEVAEYEPITMRQASLLRGVVEAIKGKPPESVTWSHHDAPELAAAVVAELPKLVDAVRDIARRFDERVAPIEAERDAALAREKRLRELLDAVAQEGHTMGRIYAAGGEKLSPAEEFARVSAMVMCKAALAGEGE